MWRPEVYLAYGDQRLRPARHLLRQVACDAPATVIDLGCGPGNSTALLRARWPEAALSGLDSSPSMLAKARASGLPGVDWMERDIIDWTPEEQFDVIYSNAVLHWLPDHAGLLPRLAAAIAPGGALAIQMPRNFAAPSHVGIAETVRAGPWRDTLEPMLREAPVHAATVYHRILAPHVRALDIWESDYLHVLTGANAVYEWVKGSTLTPLLAALEDGVRAAFEDACRARLRDAYPPGPDGSTLFPFRRLFIVAAK